jgi:glycosyltransferase involved in cell wall biosynthesis
LCINDDWFELKNVFAIGSSFEGFEKAKPPFVLFYGGILAPDRGLLACATAVSQEPDWEFHLYGQGSMVDLLKNANYPNVFVHEPIPHEDLMRNAKSSDLFLAKYDPVYSNNKFTASNKLFEAAQLGIPLLSNNGTSLGDTVIALDLGWSVEYDDIQQIRTTLNEVSKRSDSQNLVFVARSLSYFDSQIDLRLEESARIENRLKTLLGEIS